MLIDGREMVKLDENSLDSSLYADIRSSIAHSERNKILLDNIGTYYKFKDIVFSTTFLRKYEHTIMSRTSLYKIQKDHLLRPEYVSYEIYNTPDLWYLILFVNNMVKPAEFTKRTIKVFNPVFIEVLNDIIEQESSNVRKSNNPLELEKSLIRNLNQPSKRILSSDYDRKIKPIEAPDPNNKLHAINSFKIDFKDNYKHILRNKILKKNYTIADNSGKLVYLTDTELVDDVRIQKDIVTGLPRTWNDKFRQEFEGYIYPKSDGKYEFKPIMLGTVKLWLDDEEVASLNSENFTASENIFETQTKNSDFKKGNTNGWTVGDSRLVTDEGKKVLWKNYFSGETKGSNLATIHLGIDDIKTYQDLVLTTRYKSISNKNLLFSGGKAVVEYTNGLKEEFENNSKNSFFNNNGNYIDASLILTFQKELKLKSIKVDFPVDIDPYHNEEINGEVFISSFKAQPVIYWTREIELEKRWYKFKLRYDMIEQPTSYLQLLWKKPNEEYFTRVSSIDLSCIPDENIENKYQDQMVLNKIYNNDKSILFTELANNSNKILMRDNNPDPTFVPSNQSYTIIQNSRVKIMPRRKYRIVGNDKDTIEVYKDGTLWLSKPEGSVSAERPFEETSAVNRYANMEVIYKHHSGNGNLSFDFEVFPDKYNRPNWGKANDECSYLIEDFNEEWEVDSNIIKLEKYSKGISNYYYDGITHLDDYRIETFVDFKGNENYGSVGIMFRMQDVDEYYLYVMNRNETIQGTQYPVLSGLYKISPRYSEINLTNDGMYKLRGKLLQSSNSIIKEDSSSYIFIMLHHNTIRIFNQLGSDPIIEYTDGIDPFLEGSFGFKVFNMRDVTFFNTEVLY